MNREKLSTKMSTSAKETVRVSAAEFGEKTAKEGGAGNPNACLARSETPPPMRPREDGAVDGYPLPQFPKFDSPSRDDAAGSVVLSLTLPEAVGCHESVADDLLRICFAVKVTSQTANFIVPCSVTDKRTTTPAPGPQGCSHHTDFRSVRFCGTGSLSTQLTVISEDLAKPIETESTEGSMVPMCRVMYGLERHEEAEVEAATRSSSVLQITLTRNRRINEVKLAFSTSTLSSSVASILLKALRCSLRAPQPDVDHVLHSVLPTTRSSYNETAVRFPGKQVLHAPLLEACSKYPSKVAVVAKGRSLTFHELLTAATILARKILRLVPRRSLVSVAMRPGWEQVVAVFAILCADCTYLPINAEDPRAAELVRSSALVLVVVEPPESRSLASGKADKVVPSLVVSEALFSNNEPDATSGAVPPEQHRLPFLADPTSRAYIIFTSGSSGTPKGVVISHQSAWNTIMDINQRYNVGPGDCVLGLSALHFDLSVYDIFGVLGAGGRLVLPDSSFPDPDDWEAKMRLHRVNIWNSVPEKLRLLHELYPEAHNSLRLAMLSGDKFPLAFAHALQRHRGGEGFAGGLGLRLVALGGATEVSIWSCFHEVTGTEDIGVLQLVPYGRPLANQTMYVLDEEGRICADGVTGEICFGGAGVAMEYLNDPDKTQQKFIQHPRFGRLYKTGDVGFYLPDGEIYICGRKDNQFKFRGQRIEPGEIEKRLEALLRERFPANGANPSLRVAVALQEDAHGEKLLRAYVQGCKSRVAESAVLDALRAESKTVLPADWVPGDWVIVTAFPLTPNGKVDRSRLSPPPSPAPSTDRSAPNAETTTASARTDEMLVQEEHCSLKSFRSDARLDDLVREGVALGQKRNGVAVEHSDGRIWSYERLASDIALFEKFLAREGVRHCSRVALSLPPSYGAVVAVVACWGLGAVDVPMDTNFSLQRVEKIFRDTKPDLVLADPTTFEDLAKVAGSVPVRRISDTGGDDLGQQLRLHLGERMLVGPPPDRSALSPNDIAYVSYTSGSTGVPKGVEKSHRGLVNSITDLAEKYGLATRPPHSEGAPADEVGEEKILLSSPISWEPFKRQLLFAVAYTHTLVIPSAEKLEVQDMGLLKDLIRRRGVTFLNTTPSIAQRLDFSGLPTLRRLVLLGEKLSQQTYDMLRQSFRGLILCEYGFTESAFVTALKVLHPGTKICDATIGTPCRNVRCYVLNPETMQATRRGEKGVLFVGGAGVAKGYLSRPEETKARFRSPNPFQTLAERMDDLNSILYCTGDVAVRLESGVIEFHGRVDHQVKVNGVRTEMGEIEAVAVAVEGVEQAVAVVVAGDSLVVFYTGTASERFVVDSIRSSSLLASQWPRRAVRLEKLPLNGNGKVDRLALERVECDNLKPKPKKLPVEGVAPQANGATPHERKPPKNTFATEALRSSWAVALRLDDAAASTLGEDSDFFAMGGDSLKVAHLCSDLRRAHGLVVQPPEVFSSQYFGRLLEKLSIGAPLGSNGFSKKSSEMPTGDARRDKNRKTTAPGNTGPQHAPVSPVQHAMLLPLVKNSPDPQQCGSISSYVNQSVFVYESAHLDSYAAGWRTAMDRHETLRCAFDLETVPFSFSILREVRDRDWLFTIPPARGDGPSGGSPLPASILGRFLQEKERARFPNVVDAARNRKPLLRVALCPLSELDTRNEAGRTAMCTVVVVITYHHLILDGWSLEIVLNTVHEAYLHVRGDGVPGKKDAAVVANRLVQGFLQLHEKQNEATVAWRGAVSRWLRNPSGAAGRLHRHVEQDASTPIETEVCVEFAASPLLSAVPPGLTVHSVAQAAVHFALRALTKEGETSVGTVISIRDALGGFDDPSSFAGMTIGTVPIQLDLRVHAEGMQQMAVAVHEQVMDAMSNPAANFSEWPGKPIDCLFVLENYPAPTPAAAIKYCKLFDVESVDMPLAVLVWERNRKLVFTLRTYPTWLSASDVELLAFNLRHALCTASATPVAFPSVAYVDEHTTHTKMRPEDRREAAGQSIKSVSCISVSPATQRPPFPPGRGATGVFDVVAQVARMDPASLTAETRLPELANSLLIAKIVGALKPRYEGVNFRDCYTLCLGEVAKKLRPALLPATELCEAATGPLTMKPAGSVDGNRGRKGKEVETSASSSRTTRYLTTLERRILLADELAGTPGLYHMEVVLLVEATSTSKETIVAWLERCVRAHGALRVSEVDDDAENSRETVTVLDGETAVEKLRIDEQAVETTAELRKCLDAFFVKPFYARGACSKDAHDQKEENRLQMKDLPIRAQLVTCEVATFLQVVAHHAFIDGVSVDVLLRLLMPEGGVPADGNWEWERAPCAGGEICDRLHTREASRRFWAEALSNCEEIVIPPTAPRSLELGGGCGGGGSDLTVGQDQQFVLGRNCVQLLRGAVDGSLFSICATAVALAISAFGGPEIFALGYAASIREEEGSDDVGMLTQLLPLRICRPSPTERVRDVVQSIHDQLLAGHEHRAFDVPSVGKDACSLMQQVVLSFQDLTRSQASATAFRVAPVDCLRRSFAKFPLTFFFTNHADGTLEVVLTSSVGKVPEPWSESLMNTIQHVLESMPEKLSAASLISAVTFCAAGKGSILAAPASEIPLGRPGATNPPVHEQLETLPKLFMRAAARFPHRTALVSAKQQLSFAGLAARAAQVSHTLLEKVPQLSAGDAVAVVAGKSVDAIVAILGVLLMGAAYVPLDPSWGDEKVQNVLLQAKAKAVLVPQGDTTGVASPWFSRVSRTVPGCEGVILTEEELASKPTEAPASARTATVDDLAYVIFTSGTTGHPKGVCVEHRTLAKFRLALLRHYFPREGTAKSDDDNDESNIDRCGDEDVNRPVLLLSNAIFDFSVEQLLLSLFSGHTGVLPSETDVYDHEYLAGQNVAYISGTPTQVIYFDFKKLPCVRHVTVAGEPLHAHHFSRIRSSYRGPLTNAYGITETTVYNTVKTYGSPEEPFCTSVGTPIAETRIVLMSWNGQCAPLGGVGEALLFGDCLARGYCDAAQTKERFQDRPDFGRTYVSGDLMRTDPQTRELHFQARKDRQMKLNGHRIEAQEVERLVAEIPEVHCSVLVRRRNGVAQRDEAILFFSSTDRSRDVSGDVLGRLRRSLPRGLLACLRLRQVPQLPTTVTGKVDERRLLDEFERDFRAPPTSEEDHLPREGSEEAPQSEMESVVATAWRGLFCLNGLPERSADFFNLGGHSQLVGLVRGMIVSRVPSAKRLRHSDIFQYRVLKDLASFLEALCDNAAPSVVGVEGNGESWLVARPAHFEEEESRPRPLAPVQAWAARKWGCGGEDQRWCLTFEFAVDLGAVDRDRLSRAWVEAVEAHSAFQTRLHWSRQTGEWEQRLVPRERPPPLEWFAVTADPCEIAVTYGSKQRALSAVDGPTVCGAFIEERNVVRFSVLHQFFDTRSASIFVDDIQRSYGGGRAHGSSLLLWEKQAQKLSRSTEVTSEDQHSWSWMSQEVSFSNRTMRNDAINLNARGGTQLPTRSSATVDIRRSPLLAFCAAWGCRVDDILCAAFVFALRQGFPQWARSPLFVTAESSGRPARMPLAHETIGWLTAMHPLVVDPFATTLTDVLLAVVLHRLHNTQERQGIEYGYLHGYTADTLPLITFNHLGMLPKNRGDDALAMPWSPVLVTLADDRTPGHGERNDALIDVTTMERDDDSIHIELDGRMTPDILAMVAATMQRGLGALAVAKGSRWSSKVTRFRHLADNPVQWEVLNSEEGRGTVFLFPPGEGGIESYMNNLARSPELQRFRLVVLSNAFVDRGCPADATFESLAPEYIWHMRRLQRSGPIFLGGWSFGGVLALEIAAQLSKSGAEVGGVFLVDSFFATRQARRNGFSTSSHRCAADDESNSIDSAGHRINDDYAPNPSRFCVLSEKQTTVTLFKTMKPYQSADPVETAFYAYYAESTANGLDSLIPWCEVRRLEDVTHHDWVMDGVAVETVAKFVGSMVLQRNSEALRNLPNTEE